MIRIATIDDAPSVATVLIESRKAFQPFAPSVHPEVDVRRWVREELMPMCRVHVAQVGQLVCGVIACSRPPDDSWIRQLFVLPGWTGRGIGTLLLHQAHAALQPPIRLYTFQQNVGARRFYERHGYVPVAFSDGRDNEEQCPDVLYVRHGRQAPA